MSLVVNQNGQYFRLDIVEVARPDQPDKAVYHSWCSDGFKELQDLPKHACTRRISGPAAASYDAALRHAVEWIKISATAHQPKQPKRATKVGGSVSVIYTVWLFRGDESVSFEFEEYVDASAFAKAAEKCSSMTKIGITNNESPQYLTLWERG